MTRLTDQEPITLELTPDPVEPREMRDSKRVLIADEDIGTSRIVVSQTTAEAIADSNGVGIVTLDVTFHSDRGNRFVYAKLMISADAPEGTVFVDCQPRETIVVASEVAVDAKGAMTLGIPNVVGSSAETGRKISFTGQHRVLRAVGAGTDIVTWEFEEIPDRAEGILHHLDLALTLPAGVPITCTLAITADLAHPGLDGRLMKFRRMIFGPRRHELILEIPAIPPPPERSRIWRGLDKLFRT